MYSGRVIGHTNPSVFGGTVCINLDFDILLLAQFILIFHFIFNPKKRKSPGQRRSQLRCVRHPDNTDILSFNYMYHFQSNISIKTHATFLQNYELDSYLYFIGKLGMEFP